MTLGLVKAKYAAAFLPKEMRTFEDSGFLFWVEVIGSSLSETDSSVTYP